MIVQLPTVCEFFFSGYIWKASTRAPVCQKRPIPLINMSKKDKNTYHGHVYFSLRYIMLMLSFLRGDGLMEFEKDRRGIVVKGIQRRKEKIGEIPVCPFECYKMRRRWIRISYSGQTKRDETKSSRHALLFVTIPYPVIVTVPYYRASSHARKNLTCAASVTSANVQNCANTGTRILRFALLFIRSKDHRSRSKDRMADGR